MIDELSYSEVNMMNIKSFTISLMIIMFSNNSFANNSDRAKFETKIKTFKSACAEEIVSLCEKDEGPKTMKCMIENVEYIANEKCKSLVEEAKKNPPPHPPHFNSEKNLEQKSTEATNQSSTEISE